MVQEDLLQRLRKQLGDPFRPEPSDVRIVYAPYRICPLGAHIDHQLGPVTAMALDQGVLLAYAPMKRRDLRLASMNFEGEVEFSFDNIPEKRDGDWGNYARGAVRALQREHRLERGLVGLTAGILGEGGLSSSAAIGVAYLLALEDVNALLISMRENILLDQYIENEYLGLQNGILDQAAILASRRNHLTKIDCANVKTEVIPRARGMPDFAVLIAFSGLKKALVGTDYNRRVDECAEAAGILLEAVGRPSEKPLLGNVKPEEHADHKARLTREPARRAAHFFSEVERVEKGIDAWKTGDLDAFGRLMTASGESSIVNYECGAPPLIDLFQIMIETEGVYGARFSGAGFRGCCVALVQPDAAEEAAGRVGRTYESHYPHLAENAPVLICGSDDGARIMQ